MQLAEELGMQYLEISAKTKENVEQAFIDLTRAILKRLIQEEAACISIKGLRFNWETCETMDLSRQSVCCICGVYDSRRV
jgi:hypothetical protein